MSRFIGRNTIAFAILYTLVAVAQGTNKDTKYHGDSDSIMFPGSINDRSRYVKSAMSPVQPARNVRNSESISLDLARKIDSADSVDEILQIINYSEVHPGALDGCDAQLSEYQAQFAAPLGLHVYTGRMGDTKERSNVEKPKPAKCMPELQTVLLKQDNDPSTIYIPECTRVKRCGGCCTHALFSCQPTATETRNFEVLVVTIVDFKFSEKRIVPLEEHTECACDCKTKEKDCNEKQIYYPDECICVCKNVDEETKCLRNNDTKLWNPNLCTCSCRQEMECSTGFFFDHNTCRCRQIPLSRTWFQPTKGTNYGFGQTERSDNTPPVIIPLDPSDPRRKPKPDPEYK
ncbi:Platelet-derived growth factor subunit A [Anthophora quadrimaculata]